MTRPDVLVLGGGIIGLACARELARAGAAVAVIERDRAGAGASSAAAGMLAPLAEAGGSDAFFAACRRSRDLWPEWAAALEDESGLELDYDRSGALVVDETRGRALEALARRHDEPAEILDAADLRALVPDLAPGIERAVLLPGEHRVDNRRAVAALARSLERAGVPIETGREALRVEETASGVRVVGDGWTRDAGRLLLAAGAWSGRIAGLAPLPIRPVRGQMFDLDRVDWPWQGTVWGAHEYAVRRAGGGLLIGATVEEAGFERATTAAGLGTLFDFCRAVFPPLAERPVRSAWSGLRPAAPDLLPVVGALDERVSVACGHYRNGILLAPWTARVVARHLLGDEPDDPSLAAFSPDRFARRPAPVLSGR